MSTNDASSLPFMKMHGLGNDFVVIDRRAGGRKVSESLVLALGDRHRGVGFDQLAVIEPHDSAAAKLIFYNSDGSASAACGNATRCIAAHLMDESGHTALSLVTERGTLACERRGDLVSVNMGAPVLDWRDIPLAQEVDTLALPIDGAPVATGMGNPHCTFFVDNADAIDLAARGAEMERHPLYPERTNVQFASLIAPDRLRMRVWERGVGVTLASGSSSCAVAVAAARTGRTGRHVTLTLDGGTLDVEWRDDGVWMTGPTAHVFNGELTDAFLSAL